MMSSLYCFVAILSDPYLSTPMVLAQTQGTMCTEESAFFGMRLHGCIYGELNTEPSEIRR